jgi:hypothetical protein
MLRVEVRSFGGVALSAITPQFIYRQLEAHTIAPVGLGQAVKFWYSAAESRTS